MKKITLFFLAFICLAFSWQTSAQVQVGSGTTNSSYLPISSCWNYSYTQQVFYASEINSSGSITSLSFYLDPATDITDFSASTDWTIYLGHSSRTEFVSTTDWEDAANLSQVYTGTVTFPAEDNWFEIILDTPFAYNGTDNLILAVDENLTGYGCSMYWQTTAASVDRGIAYRSDSTNPDPAAPPTASSTYAYYSNIVFGGIAQSCPTPSYLTAGTITTTSAELGWTENGSATSWNVEVVTAGTAPTGTATDSGVANPFSKSGLVSVTDYEFYVQADCGGETSAWAGPFAFSTICESFGDFTENFDAVSTPDLPSCWSKIENSTSIYANVTSSTSQDNSAPNSIRFYNSSDTAADLILITPDLGSDLTSNRVRFSALDTDSNGLIVGTITDPTDAATFTAIETVTLSSTHTEYSVNFDTYAGTDTYVAFKMSPSGTYDYTYLDDFAWEPIPSCLEPSALTAGTITTTSAELGWTEGGSATSWNVEIVTAGTTPTGTATDSGVTNPFSKSGLMASTNYEFYVQADCGGDTSAWTGPFAFATLCDSFGDFTENFDAVSTPDLPNCWSKIENSTSTYANVTSSTSQDNSAPNSIRLYNSSDTAADLILITPDLGSDLTANRVRFSALDADSNGLIVGTITDPTDAATFTAIETVTLSSTYMEYSVNFDTYAGTDTYIAFKMSPSGTYDYTYIDDFAWEPIPSCLEPSALTADTIGITSAELGWTEGGSATSWNVEVVTAGTTPTGTATDSGVTNPFSKTGLTAATDYEFYVQADCGGETSAWAGPFAFTTLCDVFTAPFTEDFTTFLPNCWEEGDNTEIATGPNGTNGAWQADGFLNSGTTGAVKVNLYGTFTKDWLVSPTMDFSSGNLGVAFDVAVTAWGGTGAIDMGSDDEVQLLISSDGGATWTNLMTWNAANNPTELGTYVVLDLSPYTSATTKIAFWATDGATNDAEDYDFFIDNFGVDTYSTLLSVEDFQEDNFRYFPNPVENVLSLRAQNTMQNVVILNMLGQQVLNVSPNVMSSDLDMSTLSRGTYFVRVSINGTTENFKIIKE